MWSRISSDFVILRGISRALQVFRGIYVGETRRMACLACKSSLQRAYNFWFKSRPMRPRIPSILDGRTRLRARGNFRLSHCCRNKILYLSGGLSGTRCITRHTLSDASCESRGRAPGTVAVIRVAENPPGNRNEHSNRGMRLLLRIARRDQFAQIIADITRESSNCVRW